MRRLTFLLAAGAMVAFSACKGNSGATDDTDGGEPVQNCNSDDGVSPSISSATIRCEPPLQEDQPPFLYVKVQASDPQGNFTLQRFGDHLVKIYLAANDQETFSQPLITCADDSDGACEGSINGNQAGVSCGTMNNYYFTAVIADDDKNLSPECRLIEE